MPLKKKNSAANVAAEAEGIQGGPSTLSDGLSMPGLLVFDLDYTLWPFWCDTHVMPPLKVKKGSILDRYGEEFAFYDDVPGILAGAKRKNVMVAAASRTSAANIARELLKLLQVPGTSGSSTKAIESFDNLQIYPGSKTAHLSKLKAQTGVNYADMLFFDDEVRNKNVEELRDADGRGVTFSLVRDGVTNSAFDEGVEEWRRRGR